MNDKKKIKTKQMETKTFGLCVVPDCLSAFFPGCGTRFHLFPENVKRRKKWLKSLNLKPKDLYAGAKICYFHFDPSCYTSSNPKNTLRPCAVPTAKWNWHYENNRFNAESVDIEKELEKISDVSSLNEDDISDGEFDEEISSAEEDDVKENNSKAQKEARKATSKPKARKNSYLKKEAENGAIIKMEMDHFEETGVDEIEEVENVLTHVCRTCLATGCKMYSMKQYNLEQTYLLLCGVTAIVFDEKKMPQMVCYECDRRLRNFMEFREKTFTAWSVLKQLIEQNRLTMADVKSIDRHQTSLASNLVYTLYEPNYYDINLEEYEVENQSKVEDSNSNEATEINMDLDEETNDVEVEKTKESDDINIELDGEKNEVEVEKTKESDDESDKWEFENEDNSTCKQDLRVDNEYCVVAKKGNTRSFQDFFTVKTMTPEEQREEVLNRKNSSKYKNSRFKCDKCFVGYKLEKAFSDHMKRHTNENGELICDICKTHFHRRGQLVLHISKSHNKYISCKFCTFGTTLKTTALNHKNYHDGFRFQCTMCPKHYSKQSTYVDHIRRVHPEDLICHLCGISLPVISHLDSHLRHVHKAEDRYLLPPTQSSKFGPVQRKQVSEYTVVSYASTLPETSAICLKCNIRFRSEEALQMHLSQAPTHGHPPIYQPPESSRRRGQYCNKSKKIQKTKTSVTYTCEQCGDVLPELRMYLHHYRIEHPGETSSILQDRAAMFVCEICGKSYRTKYLLNDHRAIHTGGTPHTCDVCNKTFLTKMRLRAHQVNHTQSRACPVCGKVFSAVSNVSKHMRIHTRKPYECDTCNKRFSTPSDKRNHIRHAHMGVPWPKKKPKGAAIQRQVATRTVKAEAETELMRTEQSIQGFMED